MPIALSVLLALGAIAALLVAARHNRLVTVAVAEVLALGLAWVVAFAAAATDFRDADGFIDCWPHCSVVQNATGVGLFYGPVIALLVVLATVAIGIVQRRRSGSS